VKIIFEVKIIEELIGITACELNGSDIRELRRPCVYVWVRGDEILYVGKGSNGIERPLSATHHRLREDAIEETDRLLFYPVARGSELVIERTLIEKLKPRLNKTAAMSVVSEGMRAFAAGESDPPRIENLVYALHKTKGELAKTRKEIKRLKSTWPEKAALTLPDIQTLWPQPIEHGDYGPIIAVDGPYEGTIGYYDDDDTPDYFWEWAKAEHDPTCKACSANEPCAEIEKEAEEQQEAIVEIRNGGCIFVEHQDLRRLPEKDTPKWIREYAALIGLLYGGSAPED
jgi:hypothetical protein